MPRGGSPPWEDPDHPPGHHRQIRSQRLQQEGAGRLPSMDWTMLLTMAPLLTPSSSVKFFSILRPIPTRRWALVVAGRPVGSEKSNMLDISRWSPIARRQPSPSDRPTNLGHTHGVAGAVIGRRPQILTPVFPKLLSGYCPLGNCMFIL